MVPYDVPVVAHDMILRFMDVDFKRLGGGSGTTVISSVGDSVKQVGAVEGTPKPDQSGGGGSKGSTEQDKAMWEGSSLSIHRPPEEFTN